MPNPDFNRTIIVANGNTEPGPALTSIIEMTQHGGAVIAADGGADNALQLDLQPDVVIGDMDSIRPETLHRLKRTGAEIIRHSTTKDETDLELALLEAVGRGAAWIRIIGATGDRIDQTFGNVYLLQISALDGLDVRMVTSRQTFWIAEPGTHDLEGEIGDTISLLPIGQDVGNITTQNLKYPLDNETLRMGPARGISNVIDRLSASVTFKSGRLLIVHTIGRA